MAARGVLLLGLALFLHFFAGFDCNDGSLTFLINFEELKKRVKETAETTTTKKPTTIKQKRTTVTIVAGTTIDPHLCPIWTSYNYDDAPAKSGFRVGTNANDAPIYVGRAPRNGAVLPGRVQLTDPKGLFVSGPIERRISSMIEFLTTHESCSYAFRSAIVYAKGDRVVASNVNIGIGRKVFRNGRMSLSRINLTSLIQWYSDEQGVEASDRATEVLVWMRPHDVSNDSVAEATSVTKYNFDAEANGFDFF